MIVRRERCRGCGTMLDCYEQLTLGGGHELVPRDPSVCIGTKMRAMCGKPCWPESRADRMSRDTSKRMSRRRGFRA